MNDRQFSVITGDNVKHTYIEYLSLVFGGGLLFDSTEQIIDIRERFLHNETTKTILITFISKKEKDAVVGVFTLDKNAKGGWQKRCHMYLSATTVIESAEMAKAAQVLFGEKDVHKSDN